MWIVVTDLDGTLLNHDDYSWEGARRSLIALESHGVPVVLCSSKTRAEMELLRVELGNRHPFIVENGAALFLPEEDYSAYCGAALRRDKFVVIELGTPYEHLVEALRAAAEECGCRVRGFADASNAEVAAWCGFSEAQAGVAKQREYDEPFLVESGNADELLKAIERRGFRWTRGGRFFHILGNNDKGAAVARLRAVYASAGLAPQVAALGDSPNDLPMLLAADCPIVIPSGSVEAMRAALPNALVAPEPGSRGWGKAIDALLPQWLSPGTGAYPTV